MFTIISVVCLGLWQIWAQRNFLKVRSVFDALRSNSIANVAIENFRFPKLQKKKII
jgi:hypothetical protein